jgi:large subunit ribosomal protein L10
MALTRARKTQKVEALAKELAGSTSAIVGTFSKLTVSQDFALRQKVREAGGSYRVLKNKLAARASVGTGIEAALQGLKGVSSVAYTSGDPVALAKALSAWVKENAEFTFKLGIVEGKVITVEEVQSLAIMPGKSEIYAKLLFLINAPAQRLVTVLSATSRDLAVVINQGVEKGKFSGGENEKVVAAPANADALPHMDASASSASHVAVVEAVSAPETVTPDAPAAEATPTEAFPAPVESFPASEAPAAPVEAPAAPIEAPAAPIEGGAVSEAAAGGELEAGSDPKQAEQAASELPVEG